MYDNLKPKFPSNSGRQFADDSMTPAEISVSYDECNNEMAADRPNHAEITPGKGELDYYRPQYDDGPGKSGYGSYGVAVKDHGQNPEVERTSVNAGRADRGRES